jgi:hypothetical protein
MPTVAENMTEAYFRDAQPSVTMMNSRPAQAYVRLVDPEPLPAWLSVKTSLAKSASETKPAEIELPRLNTAPSRADTVIAQLMRLEKLEADWDGSEAAKPLDYSIKEARLFIRKLSPESIMPRATLHADGHAILFVREPDIYAEIEFLGNSKIDFYARRGDEKWGDEIFFNGQSLPEGLSKIGFSL